MGRLFGTDGIRGIANRDLSIQRSAQVGQALATVLRERLGEGKRPKVFIGKDTRLSSDMIEAALTAGLCAGGADCVSLGVVPTPAVAFLPVAHRMDAGVMISASHNPFQFNGIKIFGPKGYKLTDREEAEIEDMILDDAIPMHKAEAGEIGRYSRREELAKEYVRHIAATVPGEKPFAGMRVLVDCANGAASATAARLFDRFSKLRTDVINADPDGVNINDKCGSTHMDALAAMVKAGGYDMGIAFDGDADRCLAVDEQGSLIDGDQIMAACGLDMKAKGGLPGDTVVATVMSNLGFHVYAKEHGMKLECTDVGDRNVLERMVEKGYALGGEQSGHMIFLDHATTGDGQLTALQILALLKESGKKASQVFSACPRYPQVLINIPVADNDVKKAAMASPLLAQAVAREEEALSGEGRVLVRPSGTEALMRVMVEARTQEDAQKTAQRLADLIPTL